MLVGPSGAGKSTFAARYFLPTQIVSSDACRAMICDDEESLAATRDAFQLVHLIVAKRLIRGKLTVVDATNVHMRARRPLLEIARKFYCPVVVIVFDLPEAVCQERNLKRPGRVSDPEVVTRQARQMRRLLGLLKQEGYQSMYFLHSCEEVDQAEVCRQPSPNLRLEEHGPFDIIGDVHGCFEELVALLGELGYRVEESLEAPYGWQVTPPPGRKLIFLGDLVDRGPGIMEVLKLVMGLVEQGKALAVPGNHDRKLLRWMHGHLVQVKHGLEQTVEQLEGQPPEFVAELSRFLESLRYHYVLDDGRLVVAHAGMKERMQGRDLDRTRSFALFGETTGEVDEFGLPIRCNWALHYSGRALVVYGHTPVAEPTFVNNTINIDTGCVFGGKLTALRYPERELVSVPARRVYVHTPKPFLRKEDQHGQQ